MTLDVHDRATSRGEPFEGDFRSLFVYVRATGSGGASAGRRCPAPRTPPEPLPTRPRSRRGSHPAPTKGNLATMTSRPDRRHALTLAATVGLSPAVLAACGGKDSATDTPDDGDLDTGHTAIAPSPGPLTSAADVPVGGGLIFPEEQVVVTQPTEGEFKCFTAVCTHQGCIVSSVQAGGIRCECHGSVVLDRGRLGGQPTGDRRPGRGGDHGRGRRDLDRLTQTRPDVASASTSGIGSGCSCVAWRTTVSAPASCRAATRSGTCSPASPPAGSDPPRCTP